MRIVLGIALSLALGTAAAQAGALLGSDPLPATSGDFDSCFVVNISAKALADVTVSIVKSGATVPEVSSTCATLAPNTHCGFNSNAVGSAMRFCTVTLKGSAKALRGRFCNTTTGVCSTIR